MTRRLFLSILLAIAVPASCLGQATPPPLARAEILGQLASGTSRSLLAHLVKIRGINFSPDASYLSLIGLAGGNGILAERIAAASAISSSGSLSDADPPFRQLGKCAELIQTGAMQGAETACRAAIEENPTSAWPLIATLRAIEREDEKPSDTIELARRAVALAPNLPEAHQHLGLALPRTVPGTEIHTEMQRASALQNAQVAVDPLNFASTDGVYLAGGIACANETLDQTIRRLLSLEPDFAPTHLLAANLYKNQQQNDRALEELHIAVRLEPDNAELHAFFAEFYRFLPDMESEIAELREAVRAEPNGKEHRLTFANTLQGQGRLPEAISEFKSLLSFYPKDSMASAMLVDIYLQQKNRPLAIEELRRFLKATSLGVDVQTHMLETWAESYRLAETLQDNGELDAAAAQYLEMLHYRPDAANAHNDYGNVLLAQNKVDLAAQEYQEALKYDPQMATAHHNLAICLARHNDFDAAIAKFREALELDPHEPHSRVFLGMALASKGDLDGAIEEFNRAISEKPENAEAHAFLGQALYLKKDPGGSIAELKRSLELDPNSSWVQNDLAWQYATSSDVRYRDYPAALALARQAVDSSKTPNPAYLDTLAEALLLNGHPREALAIEERAVSLDATNTELKTRLERFRKAALSLESRAH
jgi:tetratricopeptide (TPR) repeat protein